MNIKCANCGKDNEIFLSRFKKAKQHFCNKSCHRSFKNKIDNPSKTRDLAGENNPMFGKHPIAWNKDMKGEECHNWKGGLHKRKDGYYRINIDGERKLYHRHILDIKDKSVVHHKDHNPSNNSIDNLMVFNTQADHVKFEAQE